MTNKFSPGRRPRKVRESWATRSARIVNHDSSGNREAQSYCCQRYTFNVPLLVLPWGQATEKAKKAPKVKAPDINDEEFPGLPGMAKPKAQEASEDSDGEKANGAGEDGEDGGEDGDVPDGEKVSCCVFNAVQDPREGGYDIRRCRET